MIRCIGAFMAGVMVFLAVLTMSTLHAQPVQRPNIIVILADDLGYNEVGAFGQKEIQTPNLDQMAVEGMKFTQFYAGSPVCAPSRCTLMTGLHSGHCRIQDNDTDYLRKDDVTIAEILKSAGYTTGLFGKWGLSFYERPESYPTRKGFDHFFGYINQYHARNYYPTFLMRDEGIVHLRNVVPNEGPLGQGSASVRIDYSPTLIMEEALQFIKNNRNGPFFVYLAVTIPHINNEGRGDPDGGFEVSDLGIYKNKPWPLPKQAYAAMVTLLDRDIGRILALLKTLQIDNNTFVMFTSDNGPTSLKSSFDGNTDIIGEWFDGNGHFRGFKGEVYEGGIRVPTIFRWPGVIPAGVASQSTGAFPDLMPTFAEVAGVSAPGNIDGVSLVPVLLGNTTGHQKRFLYWFYPVRNQRAVRLGKWKAVWNGGTHALYDLTADISESNDLSSSFPKIMRRMRRIDRREHGSPGNINAQWQPQSEETVKITHQDED